MQDLIYGYIEKLVARLEKKALLLKNAAQGITADLSAELVTVQTQQLRSIINNFQDDIKKCNDEQEVNNHLLNILLTAYKILKLEKKRVIDILLIANVPTHRQAKENNENSLNELFSLFLQLQQHAKIIIKVSDFATKKLNIDTILTDANAKLKQKWLQAVICQNEKAMLFNKFANNHVTQSKAVADFLYLGFKCSKLEKKLSLKNQ